jgi:hypothetical protein
MTHNVRITGGSSGNTGAIKKEVQNRIVGGFSRFTTTTNSLIKEVR